MLALQLGTLGFAVTGIDPRPYAHEHPALEARAGTLEALSDPAERFDAAVALSGLATAGADADDPWAADAAALAHLRTLLAPGGLAVLALPAGEGVGGGRAHYDAERLDAMLDGWDVRERVYLREQDAGTWVRADAPAGRGLALVAAAAG